MWITWAKLCRKFPPIIDYPRKTNLVNSDRTPNVNCLNGHAIKLYRPTLQALYARTMQYTVGPLTSVSCTTLHISKMYLIEQKH